MFVHKLSIASGVIALCSLMGYSAVACPSKCGVSVSENKNMELITPQKKKVTPPIGEKIVEDPDIPPMFTGGSEQMKKFIASSLIYPKEASEKNIQGLVVHTFVVEKDGTLSNFVCIHHADPALDAEALRILKMMPPWRPAKLNGEVVRSTAYVPMYFRLNKNAGQSARIAAAKPIAKSDPKLAENEEIFAIVDKMPEFPGGEEKMSDYLANQIKYPAQEYQNKIEGRVVCTFVVTKNGEIQNIEVIEGQNDALNREAVRALSTMPNWIPGENNGEKVNVKCVLPIDFKVDKTIISMQ